MQSPNVPILKNICSKAFYDENAVSPRRALRDIISRYIEV